MRLIASRATIFMRNSIACENRLVSCLRIGGSPILFTSIRVLCALGALVASAVTLADPLLPPGNGLLRNDIQLLADAGVINAPILAWPMSWPEIARHLDAVSPDIDESPALAAALTRVQRRARVAAHAGMSGLQVGASVAERPDTLRTFSATPREEGEVEVGASWLGDRTALKLELTLVADPLDSQTLRPDGSYVAVTVANWIVAAGYIERWWGPGWEGSLILSSTARPIPGLTVERKFAGASRLPVLRWFGPWRAGGSIGRAEGSSVAVPDVAWFAARISFRPRPWLEAGLSRTAQFCGEGRPCDLEAFGDLLLGRDNRDASLVEAREPGNQMAGYDLRVRSPWRMLPAAFYAQLIGEDEASGLPSKFLGLLGLEAWGASSWGVHRVHVEYADTRCSFSRERPQLGCAYRNSLFPQGYRYRGRPVGHALEGDGTMYSLGIALTTSGAATWSLLGRRVDLSRDGLPAPVSAREQLKNLELQYNRAFAWGELWVGLGLDDHRGPLRRGSDVRGFVQLRQGF
jgi:hypothetical protein